MRWIVTTPWDDWSDRRNWDCPPVHEDFRRFLAEIQPDVVHLHDLQMLVPRWWRPRNRPAPRVVTMHDYWWICARLFLVDKG